MYKIILTWHVTHERSELHERLHVVVEGAVGHARSGRVGLGAAQLLLGHLLVCHGLNQRKARID